MDSLKQLAYMNFHLTPVLVVQWRHRYDRLYTEVVNTKAISGRDKHSDQDNYSVVSEKVGSVPPPYHHTATKMQSDSCSRIIIIIM